MNVARIASLRAGLPIEVRGHDHQPLLRLRAAVDRAGGGADPRRRGGGDRRRRHGVDVVIPMGGQQDLDQPVAGGALPGFVSVDGPDRRAAGAAVRHHARGGGRVRAAQPPEGAGGAGGRQVRRTRSCRCHVDVRAPDAKPKPKQTEIEFKADEGPRADTTLEALAKLKPAFHAKGTVTAGNSSQTRDGAAAAVVMSASGPRRSGCKPLARFVAFAYAGCLPEEMGIGPVYAIPKALQTGGPDAG